MDFSPTDSQHLAAGTNTANIRERFAQVVGASTSPGPDAVDVAAYLLDPPPSTARLQQLDRRRARVRIGSLIGAAVIAVLLIAPMPGARDDSSAGTSGASQDSSAEPARSTPSEPVAVPVRVDVAPTPPQPAGARRVVAPVARQPARGNPHSRSPSRPHERHEPAAPRAITSTAHAVPTRPTLHPATVPGRPSPWSTTAEVGALVPVI